MASRPMFELTGVTAGYGDADVLRGVDLRVPPGSTVALLGPNGAGKTTLLRVASGLLTPRTGQVRLDGRDLGGVSVHERAALGVCHVPEGRAVFPDLTVRENLLLFCPPGASMADAIERSVDAFPRLGSRLRQAAGTMSGGEQQMLALARAYVADPSVVLLDEVSFGLAPIIVDEIFDKLAAMSRSGVSLVIVEQFVEKALALADHVFLLQSGAVRFAGTPADLQATDVFAEYLAVD